MLGKNLFFVPHVPGLSENIRVLVGARVGALKSALGAFILPPETTMLTAIAVRAAAPKSKNYKLSDAGGLHLYVTTTGHKSWRYKYRFAGQEKQLVFGKYPEIGLSEARERRDEARKHLQQGKDPSLVAKQIKLVRSTASDLTFESFARAWFARAKVQWKAAHADRVLASLEHDVFPAIGKFDMPAINEQIVLATLQKIEKRGAIDTASRMRQRISAIFTFAKAMGACSSDPAASLGIVLQRVPKSARRPALVTIAELQELMRCIEHAGASPITKAASRFLALTAQRPGMIRKLRWQHIKGVDWQDADCSIAEAVWHVPAAEMKQEFDMRQDEAFDHIVPLAPQAVDVLRAIRPLTGTSPYAFPSARSFNDPSSENAIGYLYNREGYQKKHCPHGWRSSFSTIMNERFATQIKTDEAKAFNQLVIDLMLAHIPSGVSKTERIYNRAAYMDRRREIAMEWADLLLAGLPAARTLLDGPHRRYKD